MRQQIIDIHTHIYPVSLARRALAVAGRENDSYDKLPVKENLLARMKEAEVDISVVQHVVSKPKTQTDVNRFAVESLRTGLLAFGGLHPDCENAVEELEKLKDKNMAGVKFHPPFQKVDLTDVKYWEIWERINYLRFPVLIHCGPAREVKEHNFFPSDMEQLIRRLPDVPVVLAHMGGRWEDPKEEEILYRLPENVVIDTAMSAGRQPLADFERIAGNMGADRVLLGSDFPYGTQKEAIAYIKSSSFSKAEKEMMLGGNAKRILGI